jgi:hypothetical protein
MMRRNPKFLKALPEFYGLGFVDLGVLMVGLWSSMIFNLNPILSIFLCGIGITVSQVVRKYFDLIGWLLPRKREVFLSEINRGQG